MPILEPATSVGRARVHLGGPARPRAVLVLGHGAGGGVDAPDLLAVAERVAGQGCAVARVEQPYRVAGRRAPAPARQLDAAFTEVVAALRAERALAGMPMVVGGRSSGARVACRTAAATGAAGVVVLAFPLHPPGKPDRSRRDELVTVRVPVLVVQGRRDAFGRPEELTELPPNVTLRPVPGDHGLKAAPDEVADVVAAWVGALLDAQAPV